MLVVGITGSIGCGKTTLSRIAKKLGFPVWDIDGWVRRIYRDENFVAQVFDVFPVVKCGDKVDKKLLRNIVFNDNQQLKKLESIVHPCLRQNLRIALHKTACKKGIVVIDAALLFELGWYKFCDCIILADAPYEVRKKRVMARDNISALDFDRINDVQIPNDEKKLWADVVINTNQNINLLTAQMALLFEELKKW